MFITALKYISVALLISVLIFIGYYFGLNKTKSVQKIQPVSKDSISSFSKEENMHRTIQKALEIYFSNYRYYPASLADLYPDYMSYKLDPAIYTYLRIEETDYTFSVRQSDGSYRVFSRP